MTDSSRPEGSPQGPEQTPLYPGEVVVPYDDERQQVVLDIAESRLNSIDYQGERKHFEELRLADGLVLMPARFSASQEILDFSDSFEPVVSAAGDALLRTAAYRQDMSFLAMTEPLIVEDGMGSMSDLTIVEAHIMNIEQARIAKSQLWLRQLATDKTHPTLWVRLEATYNPPRHLAGKAIVAQLQDFALDVNRLAMIPLIVGPHDSEVMPIPESLSFHSEWLYTSLDFDDFEDNE